MNGCWGDQSRGLAQLPESATFTLEWGGTLNFCDGRVTAASLLSVPNAEQVIVPDSEIALELRMVVLTASDFVETSGITNTFEVYTLPAQTREGVARIPDCGLFHMGYARC